MDIFLPPKEKLVRRINRKLCHISFHLFVGHSKFAPFLPETPILVYFEGHLVAKTMALARLRAG